MIPPFDAKRQHETLRKELLAAAARCVDSGWYVLGAEVEAFERELAEHLGVMHVVGVANGTDAIRLALQALDLPRNAPVATVPLTAIPTVMAIVDAGLRPVFVDVDPTTANMNPRALDGLRETPAALVPVHLYGRPADMAAIGAWAAARGVPIVEDVAQAIDARLGGRAVGSFGAMGAFSFYPTKNLGALGDGGAIVTQDDALADRLRRLRFYGQTTRYLADECGINSRLDELQAALLRVKLRRLDDWTERRRKIAAKYNGAFADLPLRRFIDAPDARCVHHLYVVVVGQRTAFMEHLKTHGVGVQIHYPTPMHLQPAFRDLGYASGDFPVAEALCDDVVSLPMFPELREDEVATVIEAVRSFFDEGPA